MQNLSDFIVEFFNIEEANIDSDKELEDYSKKLLKQAHGDSYDDSIVNKMLSDLKKKYNNDYGAIVGAIQNGLTD